jgi:hypothetical protein
MELTQRKSSSGSALSVSQIARALLLGTGVIVSEREPRESTVTTPSAGVWWKQNYSRPYNQFAVLVQSRALRAKWAKHF